MKLIFPFAFLLSLILFNACLINDNDDCLEDSFLDSKLLLTLPEEDTQQSLIGDRASGGIYNHVTVAVYIDGLLKEDALLGSSIVIDDWLEPVQLDSTTTLLYLIDLPDSNFSSGFDRDTCVVEYVVVATNCQDVNPNNTEKMQHLKVVYNGDIHYEGSPIVNVPIRLDRI